MVKGLTRLFVTMLVFFSLQLTVQANTDNREEYLITEGKQTEIIHFMNEQQIPINKVYRSFSIISTNLTQDEVQTLKQKFPNINIQDNHTYNQSKEIELPSSKPVNAMNGTTTPYTGKGIKVAVLDSGIDTNHVDLKVKGGHCSLGLNCAYGIPYSDDNGHGTHVAGIISALKNDKGIIGIAPDVELYSIKALDAFGYGSTLSLIEGVEWAFKNKIDILNMSVTTDHADVALEKALKIAYDKGVLIVGSAGNNGEFANKSVRYPAKYQSVIAVGAVNSDLTKLKESAIGDEIEVVAPGGNIYSTYPIEWDFEDGIADGYTRMSGTSMATPHVTAILALYKERFPFKTNVELRTLLTSTAKDLGAVGKDPLFGYGLIQYKPTLPGTVAFTTKQELGKAFLSTLTPNVSIQTNGKKLNPIQDQWIIYGVAGHKEIFVTSSDEAGRKVVERKYIKLQNPSYKDVSNQQPASESIGFMTHQGQIKGFPDGTFRPYSDITRGEAAVLIGRALGYSSLPQATPFKDVPKSSFTSGYIKAAVDAKIITGFTDGTFRPASKVTRAEMAILVSKAYQLQAVEGAHFGDVKPSMAAYQAINSLKTAKVTTGYKDGTFKPYDKMTRADFSVFLARVQDDYFK